MAILYVEPFSGLSGDMFLSALCALADDFETVLKLPGRLHLPDGKIEIREVSKNGIVCKQVHIFTIEAGHHHHDDHHHAHDHFHHHEQHNHHTHEHHHHHHHDHQHGRTYTDIIQLIEKGHISENAKTIAKEIFGIIGRSESRIHNVPLETIHFHEISGVDSILDIVGCAVMLDKLGIEKTYCDPVCTGFGMVHTQHGIMPVPAPATADILAGIPFYKGNEAGEKVTPTGAAVLKYLNPDFEVPQLITEKIGYGPGQKNFKNANVVRLSLVKKKAH